MKHPNPTEAALSLELASNIAKACATAGITDPAEIPALVAFAIAAEEHNTALTAHELAQQAWNSFIASHGTDDPGQEYYAAQIAAAREVYAVARRNHLVALHAWRIARGLASMPLAA